MSIAPSGPDSTSSMPARGSIKSILLPARSQTPQPQSLYPHRHAQKKPPQYTPPPRPRRPSAAPANAPCPTSASNSSTAVPLPDPRHKPIVTSPAQPVIAGDLRRPTPTFSSNSRDLDRLMSEFDALIVNTSNPDLTTLRPSEILTSDGAQAHEEISKPAEVTTSAEAFEAAEFSKGAASGSVSASSEKSPKSPNQQAQPPAVYIPKRRQSYAWKEHLAEFRAS